MKNILIAIDYDVSAEKVAMHGYDLAQSMQANVTLLHVVADKYYYSDLNYGAIMGFRGSDYYDVAESYDLLDAAQAYLQKVKLHLDDNQIITLAKTGDFASTIVEVAQHQKADIIVLGSHGRRALSTLLMGSVVQKVLQTTTVPLLVVPTHHLK